MQSQSFAHINNTQKFKIATYMKNFLSFMTQLKKENYAETKDANGNVVEPFIYNGTTHMPFLI